MKLQAVIFCLLVIFGFSLANSVHRELDEVKAEFEKFIIAHNKDYSPSEYSKRFEIFKANLARIDLINAEDSGAEYGITQFADLSPEEFRAAYLMSPKQATSYRMAISKFPKSKFAASANAKDLPASFDWTAKGAVTPVKNQRSCGSCWAFGATGDMEGKWFLAGHPLPSLSEQNLVDCSHNCIPDSSDPDDCNSGCNGGWPELAFQYVIENGGIDSEASYPYQGVDGKCRFNPANVGAKITSWEYTPTNETQLAAYLVQNGPISVALNAAWLQIYFGGIMDPSKCNPDLPDHAVLITGYGTADTATGPKDYWLVKNSWGTMWGERGYFRMARGKGTCGINLYGTSSIV